MSNLAQILKMREQKTRSQLLALLDMPLDDHSTMVFDGAYEYLENVFGTDAYGMHHLPRTSQFWAWWRMEWAKIDAIFVSAVQQYHKPNGEPYFLVRERECDDNYTMCRNSDELRRRYSHYHEAHMRNRYINSEIVLAGAHRMINDIIETEKKKA